VRDCVTHHAASKEGGAGSELPSGGACAPPHVGGDGTSPPNPHPGDRRREGGGAGCGGSVRDCVTHDTASKEGGAGSELPSGGACAPPHVGGDGTSPPNPHPGDRRREGGGAGCGGSVRDCVTHDTASKEGGAGSELPSGGACAPPHVGGDGTSPPNPHPGDRRREGGGAGCGGSVRDCVTHHVASQWVRCRLRASFRRRLRASSRWGRRDVSPKPPPGRPPARGRWCGVWRVGA
jgi:hypothetical protein